MKKRKYRSKFEERTAKELTKSKVKYTYETHTFKYVIEHRYTLDFTLSNGIHIETKGVWKSNERTKHKKVLENNPNLDIRLYFMNPNLKLSKKSKTSYAEYCDKHNIIWTDSIEDIKKWSKEKKA